jgi:ADP-ribose pyrophosphatase
VGVLLTKLRVDPGFCNTNFNLVHVKVDMTLPENQNPQPDLEEDEFIVSFTLPLVTLYDGLRKLEAEGYAIDSRIGAIAEGIEMAKKFKFT